MDISVVIPLYNKEQYIARAIVSVLNQSVQPTEIIIVDDGSTDNSESVVKQYIDPRIRLITQENAGEGAARNRGFKEAKYDLIAFLDADDEWKPDFLLNIQRLHNNFPDCGAYATSYEIIGSNGEISFPNLENIPPAPWIGIFPNLIKQMQIRTPFFPSSIAIQKQVLFNLNGFPEGVKLGADRMLWIKLGIRYPIAYCPAHSSKYHFEANNRVSNTYQLENEMQIINLVDQMIENHEVPSVLSNDMRNLAAALKIQRARLLILGGKANLARKLLKSVEKQNKYWYKKYVWQFLSYVPSPILNLYKKVRF